MEKRFFSVASQPQPELQQLSASSFLEGGAMLKAAGAALFEGAAMEKAGAFV